MLLQCSCCLTDRITATPTLTATTNINVNSITSVNLINIMDNTDIVHSVSINMIIKIANSTHIIQQNQQLSTASIKLHPPRLGTSYHTATTSSRSYQELWTALMQTNIKVSRMHFSSLGHVHPYRCASRSSSVQQLYNVLLQSKVFQRHPLRLVIDKDQVRLQQKGFPEGREACMDSLGIEPRASRMLSGCDTTTPTAPWTKG